MKPLKLEKRELLGLEVVALVVAITVPVQAVGVTCLSDPADLIFNSICSTSLYHTTQNNQGRSILGALILGPPLGSRLGEFYRCLQDGPFALPCALRQSKPLQISRFQMLNLTAERSEQ